MHVSRSTRGICLSVQDGQSPLIRAVLGHNPTVAEKLLNDGAKINHVDKVGDRRSLTVLPHMVPVCHSFLIMQYHFTPLRWAVEVDDMEMIRLLLARGANPNLADWVKPTRRNRCASFCLSIVVR